MNPTNDPRSDAKLQNLAVKDQAFAEAMWRFRHPDEDGQKLPYTAILVEVPRLCGLTVSLSSLHAFYRWLELKMEMDAAAETTEQVIAELSKDATISDDQLDTVAAKVFKTQALRTQDSKAYMGVVAGFTLKERVRLDREKLSQASKSKIEAGLDALFTEIKGNARAEELFAQLKDIVSKA
jgi:hypothetical protein